MPTRFIQRRSALGPNDRSLANANAIFVDSDDNQIKHTTGASGTTTAVVATRNPAAIAAGSTLTISADTHGDRIVLLDTAAGSTITLPAATGSGLRVKFVVSITPTSNQHRINVTGDDAFFGTIVMSTDSDSADLAVVAWESGPTVSDADRINLNGTTTGGDKGDWVEVIDIATDSWHVAGTVTGTGAEATPFATGAVS